MGSVVNSITGKVIGVHPPLKFKWSYRITDTSKPIQESPLKKAFGDCKNIPITQESQWLDLDYQTCFELELLLQKFHQSSRLKLLYQPKAFNGKMKVVFQRPSNSKMAPIQYKLLNHLNENIGSIIREECDLFNDLPWDQIDQTNYMWMNTNYMKLRHSIPKMMVPSADYFDANMPQKQVAEMQQLRYAELAKKGFRPMRKVADGLLTALLKNAKKSKVVDEDYPQQIELLNEFESNLVSEIIILGQLDKEYENGDCVSQSTNDSEIISFDDKISNQIIKIFAEFQMIQIMLNNAISHKDASMIMLLGPYEDALNYAIEKASSRKQEKKESEYSYVSFGMYKTYGTDQQAQNDYHYHKDVFFPGYLMVRINNRNNKFTEIVQNDPSDGNTYCQFLAQFKTDQGTKFIQYDSGSKRVAILQGQVKYLVLQRTVDTNQSTKRIEQVNVSLQHQPSFCVSKSNDNGSAAYLNIKNFLMHKKQS